MEPYLYETSAGTFEGTASETCIHVKGIRYAQSKRFEDPFSYVYPEGVHRCDTPSPFALQGSSGLEEYLMGIRYEELPQEESCQYCSITIPKGTERGARLPVMVWFHGGGFRHGGCDAVSYNYDLLAGEQNVILVGVNYRIGLLGFGKDKEAQPANHGLLDAIEALRWIRRNIACFGGDPDTVVIFGQSAGAELVRCVMMAEGTEQLYRRAIIQSDPFGAMENRTAMERRILAELNTMPMDASVSEVKAMQKSIFAHVTEKGKAKYLVFAPHYGIYPLPERAQFHDRMKEIALDHEVLIGSNTREVIVYGGKMRTLQILDKTPGIRHVIEYLVRKLSREIFIEGTDRFAKEYAACGGRVYQYVYRWKEREDYLGAGHAMDLVPLFGGGHVVGTPTAMGMSEAEMVEKGKPMRALWAEFARSGMVSVNEIRDMLAVRKVTA